MKKLIYLIISILFLLPLSFVCTEKTVPSSSSTHNKVDTENVKDATEEVNKMEHIASIPQNEEAKEVQLLLNHFAGIINNFFNIIQNPDNLAVVAPNIADMIGGMVTIVVEAIKNKQLSTHATQKEITRYVEILLTNDQFKKRFINLITAKRAIKNHH